MRSRRRRYRDNTKEKYKKSRGCERVTESRLDCTHAQLKRAEHDQQMLIIILSYLI
jgi:hypothetical protein